MIFAKGFISSPRVACFIGQSAPITDTSPYQFVDAPYACGCCKPHLPLRGARVALLRFQQQRPASVERLAAVGIFGFEEHLFLGFSYALQLYYFLTEAFYLVLVLPRCYCCHDRPNNEAET